MGPPDPTAPEEPRQPTEAGTRERRYIATDVHCCVVVSATRRLIHAICANCIGQTRPLPSPVPGDTNVLNQQKHFTRSTELWTLGLHGPNLRPPPPPALDTGCITWCLTSAPPPQSTGRQVYYMVPNQPLPPPPPHSTGHRV